MVHLSPKDCLINFMHLICSLFTSKLTIFSVGTKTGMKLRQNADKTTLKSAGFRVRRSSTSNVPKLSPQPLIDCQRRPNFGALLKFPLRRMDREQSKIFPKARPETDWIRSNFYWCNSCKKKMICLYDVWFLPEFTTLYEPNSIIIGSKLGSRADPFWHHLQTEILLH